MGNTSTKSHIKSKRNKKQVHWKAADRPAPPGKPQLVSESESDQDIVRIRWEPPRYDGGSPIKGYLVEHRRVGSPHWVRATPLLVKFCEISLSGLEPGWKYQFKVSAENAVGLSLPSEVSNDLIVTLQRASSLIPSFTAELSDATVLENDKIEFIVEYEGLPLPKVCWFKDGFEIFSSRRVRVISENGKSVLTFHQCALSDEGEIKCTLTNRHGHASNTAKLTVNAPPTILLPRQYEEGLLFELGEIIRLKVTIAGRPTPEVFWTHNGEHIEHNTYYNIQTTDKYSSVRIETAQRNDRGEYQVKAVNKLGETNTSFLVTVTDKPAPPGQARVMMTLGRTVTLSWNTPIDDGGCKIGNYVVEYFRIGWDVWLKAATCRQLNTTVGELIEGSQYKFRIKAESPYGLSEPSNETDVVFIPDPSRGILSPLDVRSRSQTRDVVFTPTDKQQRSQSSTRSDTLPSKVSTAYFYKEGVPVRPPRNKTKSRSATPEISPIVLRKFTSNKNVFDRTSVVRDMEYGSPEIRQQSFDYETPNDNLKQLNALLDNQKKPEFRRASLLDKQATSANNDQNFSEVLASKAYNIYKNNPEQDVFNDTNSTKTELQSPSPKNPYTSSDELQNVNKHIFFTHSSTLESISAPSKKSADALKLKNKNKLEELHQKVSALRNSPRSPTTSHLKTNVNASECLKTTSQKEPVNTISSTKRSSVLEGSKESVTENNFSKNEAGTDLTATKQIETLSQKKIYEHCA